MLTRREVMRATAAIAVAAALPPGIQAEPTSIPDWSRRLDARWTANLVAAEMVRLLADHDADRFLLDGLRADGEIIEHNETAFELQWWYSAFELPAAIAIDDYVQIYLKPTAKALANIFLEQADLKTILTTKLAPARSYAGVRSACSQHPYLRIRACLSYKLQPRDVTGKTVVAIDGLFGSQMLGTPASSRRLRALAHSA